MRYIFLKNTSLSCGDNVCIYPGVYLFYLKSIKIGNNVSIHPMCYIDGNGGLEIGNDVSIAHNTSILTTNHTWNDKEIPIKYNPVQCSKVTIKNDTWIGCGFRILAGVTINERTILAAGSVLTKNTKPNSVYAGVPAKLLKEI